MREPSAQQVALVTGGSGVLGFAIAERFALKGDTVVIVDLDKQALAEATDRINDSCREGGGKAIAIAGNITSDEFNKSLIATVHSEHARLDKLVNAAGVQQQLPFGEITREEWDRVLSVNLWGPASLCQAAASIWKERPGGAVVNLGSRAWLTGGKLAYIASKGGIVGITHALASELGKYSVTVNAVAPSTLVTPIVAQGHDEASLKAHMERISKFPMLPRIATIDDVVNAVEFLASPDSSFITGEILHVAGGSQLAPATQ